MSGTNVPDFSKLQPEAQRTVLRPPWWDPALFQLLDKAKLVEVARALLDQQIAQAKAEVAGLEAVKKAL